MGEKMHEDYLKVLKEKLDDYRYNHCLAVAKQALYLAEKYGANKEDAYVAGLLHDITKNESYENQLRFIKDCGIILDDVLKNSPKLLHAVTGALFVEKNFNIHNKEILNAIRYHTTGKADMTLLEKIVYIADYTSADRNYPDVDVVRGLVEKSLDSAILYALSYTIKNLVDKQCAVHIDTLNAYNYLANGGIK